MDSGTARPLLPPFPNLTPGQQQFIEATLGDPVPALTAYGLLPPAVTRMLATHARRYQAGKNFAPHQHALAAWDGWRQAMRGVQATSSEPAAGYRRHEELKIKPSLIYLVGVAITVMCVRHATEVRRRRLRRLEMEGLEAALEWALLAYGVDHPNAINVAWVTHESALGQALAQQTLAVEDALGFWRDIVDPMGMSEAAQFDILVAYQSLAPEHLARVFEEAYKMHYNIMEAMPPALTVPGLHNISSREATGDVPDLEEPYTP